MADGHCAVDVNSPVGWRQKIAQRLIKICQRIDQSRWCLAVHFDTNPKISSEVQREIILKGHATMKTLARDTTLASMVEQAMKEKSPRLFTKEKAMQTCSHGLPLQVKCQQCTQEALSRPACYETYWIAGRGCKKPDQRCVACAGCAYHAQGQQS